ncbi:MAG: hypothetical protein K2X47_02975, partial [Bdellovibrionales bacterium]|nr:hypothetical protein [Bdellovibrionales bacterium]
MKHLILLVSLVFLSCTHSDHMAQNENDSLSGDRQIAQRGRRRPHDIAVVEDAEAATSDDGLEVDTSPVSSNMSETEFTRDTDDNLAAEIAKAKTPSDRKLFAKKYGFDPIRGKPDEFDRGPAQDTEWAKLFAETPNYRALGVKVLGGKPDDEKFRWTFGPMFYRGRLEPGRVKVFVVGQEGAQDESVSNRSFTGGTGARMQDFLNQLGIYESYLFMNTFVYTINGQYNKNENPALYFLAQGENSPLVIHRHKMFNYMLETNKDNLRLVIAVGAAARDTVATWVRSHIRAAALKQRIGRDELEATLDRVCPRVAEDKVTCDGSALGVAVKVIGVPHPGGLGKGADEDKLKGDFKNAFTQVIRWNEEADKKWLTVDTIGGRPAKVTAPENYFYGSAPVPFRDFSFATTWRLGRGGTSSNRKDKQASIQIFSEAGCYNADCSPKPSPKLKYKRIRDTDEEVILGMPEGDLAWEAPRTNPYAYDPGPSPEFATVLMGLHKSAPYPDFWAMGARTHRSFGLHGPYRGRLDEAAVLVIADQESNDDLFTGRAWTGLGGQRLQAYLTALGIQRSYAILKTLPIDTFDVNSEKRREMVLHPSMLRHREAMVREILAGSRKNKVPNVVVLAIGPFAAEAADELVRAKVFPKDQLLKLPFPQGERGIAEWT